MQYKLPAAVLEFFRIEGAKGGKIGGKVGGKRSLETMTLEQRVARAKKAATRSAIVRRQKAEQRVQSGRAKDPDGARQADRVLVARWQLIKAICNEVPSFLERLQDRVYPEYARLSGSNPDFWAIGSDFETWRFHSDRDNLLTPVLMAWAREFNVQSEEWILEGALQTLSHWHQFPHRRAKLDIDGFRQWSAHAVITLGESQFEFFSGGWNPTLLSYSAWRVDVRRRFEAALREHEFRMRNLAEARGTSALPIRFSTDHFRWLALYQCGNLSLDSILRRAPNVSDKTAISKGIHRAADLAAIAIRQKFRKLKTP